MAQVAASPRWRRTTRFELVFKKENKDDTNASAKITPNYLALHEFADGDGDVLAAVKNAAPSSVLDNARAVDVALFTMLRGFGDVGARLVETEEKKL